MFFLVSAAARVPVCLRASLLLLLLLVGG